MATHTNRTNFGVVIWHSPCDMCNLEHVIQYDINTNYVKLIQSELYQMDT